MFDVLHQDVIVDESSSRGYLFIRKNCSFLFNNKYLSNTTLTMRGRDGFVNPMVARAHGGLALLLNSMRSARVGAVISLHLFCGCSSWLWNYMMSYVMEDGNLVESLLSRFGVSMDSIKMDGMTQKNDPNEYVVHDPLLEKGKEKFNRMQSKLKLHEQEWAGKSLT